ncbi:mammalian cell entry protein [Fulvitalea axinellae]|uniref:Mammalian cell entry protein n=1 Tax=Fulvitalea axinellae TaxID=1182444 RepID=A0AAU9CJK6_9BACT|nr:mammalian cell entry protein [Fulvitalea axinellae]
MKNIKAFKVGVFIIIPILIAYFGVNFLKGVDFFSSTNHYYAVYPDVDGLTVSNPVVYKGVEVGTVTKVKILKGGHSGVLVEVSVNKNLKLGQTTEASLTSNGLTGGKSIVLKKTLPAVPSLQNGDTIMAIVNHGFAQIISDTAVPLAKKLDSLMVVYKMVGIQAEQTLASANSVARTADSIMLQNQRSIHSAVRNLSMATASLNKVMRKMEPVSENLRNMSDSLANSPMKHAITQLDESMTSMKEILGKIKDGEGALGQMVTNDSLYRNLNSSMADLDSLLIDLKENPKRYVHFSLFGGGKKDKKKKKKKKE